MVKSRHSLSKDFIRISQVNFRNSHVKGVRKAFQTACENAFETVLLKQFLCMPTMISLDCKIFDYTGHKLKHRHSLQSAWAIGKTPGFRPGWWI